MPCHDEALIPSPIRLLQRMPPTQNCRASLFLPGSFMRNHQYSASSIVDACHHRETGLSGGGYDGDCVPIPREAWVVELSDKTLRTALCPGGSKRMSRPLGLIETGRVDPLALTTRRLPFQDIKKAFQMMQTKEDGMIKPLITFV